MRTVGTLCESLSRGRAFKNASSVGSSCLRGRVAGNPALSVMSAHCARAPMPLPAALSHGSKGSVRTERGYGVKGGPGVLAELLRKWPSPIKLPALRRHMDGYPRVADGEYLWLGFSEGFRIPFQGERRPYWVPNLPSVRGLEGVVRQNIGKECKEGRVWGPFDSPLMCN